MVSPRASVTVFNSGQLCCPSPQYFGAPGSRAGYNAFPALNRAPGFDYLLWSGLVFASLRGPLTRCARFSSALRGPIYYTAAKTVVMSGTLDHRWAVYGIYD